MSKYDWQSIRDEYLLSDIVSRSVQLKNSGREMVGLCPFHQERTPSFYVNDEKGRFNCFGCGASGDVIDFVAKKDNCSSQDAIQSLTGGNVPEASAAERKARDAWLEKRRKEQDRERQIAIADATNEWSSAPVAHEEHGYLDRKQIMPHMARLDGKAIMLPVYDRNGNIQSLQTISSDGDKRFYPGAPMKGGRLNFGICIGRTIVVEGFATGASIYEDIPDRVAVGFSKFGMIDLVRELVENGNQVAIASDRNALPEMLALGAELGVPVYAPPEPHDDFNDLAVAEGEGAVRAILSGKPLANAKLPEPKTDEETEAEPVDIWARNSPPKLPKGLLPPIIERFAAQAAALSGADPGGYAMGAVTVCGSAINDRIKVKVKRSEEWKESARVWCMLIGEPSYKKSPIMGACTHAIAGMDARLVTQYDRDFMDWKEAGECGDMPVPRRLRIDDITMEAAQEVARYSPEGILAMQDELSGWFGGIEKYSGGKGSAKDRSFWLRAFGGGHYAVNRISRKPFLIENLSISVFGGIQPDAIRRVMADATDDGLIQRFFPVVLRPAEIGADDLPADALGDYDALIERLSQIIPPSNFFGDKVLTFDTEAQALRAELEVKHHGMVRAMETVNKKMSSHLGKYDGIFPRLCVIWHCIENANAEILPDIIAYDTANRAARFLHEYILRHAMVFYGTLLGLTEDQDIIEDVAGYILAHKVETVTMRTFQRGSTRMRKLTRQQVEPLCHQLEALGWLENIDARGARLSGKVNASVHGLFRDRAASEKGRREDVRKKIKSMTEPE